MAGLDFVKIGVISDTHAPRRWKRCPDEVARVFDGVELIMHAGDVCVPSVLDELNALAPVRVVLGNNDGPDVAAWGALETLEVELAGLSVAMIHDSGPKQGRLARLRRLFPAAGLVIFGHSHIPWQEGNDRFRIINPGSPTDRRRQPHGTVGLLEIVDGQLRSDVIIDVS